MGKHSLMNYKNYVQSATNLKKNQNLGDQQICRKVALIDSYKWTANSKSPQSH